jgi:hypothetical protein
VWEKEYPCCFEERRTRPIPELHEVPDNGLARTPLMGWNSWNKFAGKSAFTLPPAPRPALATRAVRATRSKTSGRTWPGAWTASECVPAKARRWWSASSPVDINRQKSV